MVMEYQPRPQDWPHQTFAVCETVRLINEGETSMCVTSPTGGGKSRIIQRLCEHYVSEGLSAVVMSNRKLLTTQLLRGLHKAGIQVGCRAAEFEEWSDLSAPVQVISGQTEISRVLNRRKRTGKDVELHRGDLLIIDEAHLQKGANTREIIDEYQSKYAAVVAGISATPLGVGYLKNLIVAGNNTELRKCGALVAARCYEPAVIDLPKVRKSKTGMFSQTELEDATKAIWSQHVVGHLFQHWKTLNPDQRPSLGMAPGVKESLGIAQEFWKRGVNAAHIDADGIFVNGEYKRTGDQRDRDELFSMVEDGTVKQIWNRFVLREAIDLPWLYMLQLATPIASLLSYVQVVGRVMRSHPSKEFALIADHCGAIRMHGSPNADRDQDWLQYFSCDDSEKITKDRHEQMTNPQKKEPEPITCPKCSMIRKTGSKCTGCGYEHQKSVRMVIQESGTLKPVKGDVYPRRRITEKPDTLKKWESIYFRFRNSNKPLNFNQAIGAFIREHHYRPPEDLKYMPKERANFSRHIKSVPYTELHGGER
jgi:DNA repair protein RadD